MNRRNGNPIKCKKPAAHLHSRNIIEKKLVKFSFKQALITPDYKNYGIFIFSFQEEDDYWDYSDYYKTPRVVLIYK